MKIVKQSGVIINLDLNDPQKYIERIGRICYKSEDRITNDSNKAFVKMLYNNKHHAMLEHYRFIMQIREDIYMALSAVRPKHFEFTNTEYKGEQRFVISFNARALMNLADDCIASHVGILPMMIRNLQNELIGHIIREYGCRELFGYGEDDQLPLLSTAVKFIENSADAMNESEWSKHGWFSAHMVTDRGITHEIVRHREETSFAQESTRYCNYNNGKFGGEITVIDQGFDGTRRAYWQSACEQAESMYNDLIHTDLQAQWARSVLPTCTKAEIVMTAPIYEWRHFFNLRLRGKAGTPHPLMQELALQVYDNAKEVEFLKGGSL